MEFMKDRIDTLVAAMNTSIEMYRMYALMGEVIDKYRRHGSSHA